jgi:protein-tyrosine phosphatase
MLKRSIQTGVLVATAAACLATALWAYHAHVFVDNFDIVVPGKLYRSRQPRRDDYPTLQRYRIARVVNLRAMEEDPAARREQRRILDQMQIDHVEIPIAQKVPSTGQVRAFFQAVDTSPGPVLVHCQHGEDRSGILVAAWRVARQGWSIEKALHDMRRHRCRISGAKLREVRALLETFRSSSPHSIQP